MTAIEQARYLHPTRYASGKIGFSLGGCGIDTDYNQITEEEYEKYAAVTKEELREYVRENVISDAVRYGYGYYGADIWKDHEGIPFLGISSGNSCD